VGQRNVTLKQFIQVDNNAFATFLNQQGTPLIQVSEVCGDGPNGVTAQVPSGSRLMDLTQAVAYKDTFGNFTVVFYLIPQNILAFTDPIQHSRAQCGLPK